METMDPSGISANAWPNGPRCSPKGVARLTSMSTQSLHVAGPFDALSRRGQTTQQRVLRRTWLWRSAATVAARQRSGAGGGGLVGAMDLSRNSANAWPSGAKVFTERGCGTHEYAYSEPACCWNPYDGEGKQPSKGS